MYILYLSLLDSFTFNLNGLMYVNMQGGENISVDVVINIFLIS